MAAAHVRTGPVRTWYDTHGAGASLVLLHGGLMDARTLGPLIPALSAHFRVLTPERRGHGHTPDVEGPLSFGVMTADTIAFLEAVLDGPADLGGYSDGAIIAMLVALRRPDLVKRLVLIGGGFNLSGAAAPVLEGDLEPVVQSLGPAYAEISPDGAEHFRVVVHKAAEMLSHEPDLDASELAGVRARTLLLFSDDDWVTMQHVTQMYDALPDAELAVVPGTSHFMIDEKPALVTALILDFLLHEPVPTVAGLRRPARGGRR